MSSISFSATARTIDHLGKGQIADTPTAVSELWKNSYDAYARNVALHTFDGDIQSAAVMDNGCGMTLDQIINKWLVIGTNSKTQKKALPENDRFGLNLRKTQGEKGIGRLSAAFLAPITLLISKKIDTDFSAVLIDWRLFENPYLSISDILVPYRTFKSLEDLEHLIKEFLDELKVNLALNEELLSDAGFDAKRKELIKAEENGSSSYKEILSLRDKLKRYHIKRAWDLLSKDELETNPNEVTTEAKISKFCDNYEYDNRIVHTWSEYLKEVNEVDGGDHGTSLFLLDVNRELSLLTNRGEKSVDNFELSSIRDSLTDTLKAFTDPFDKASHQFSYEIKAYKKDLTEDYILNDFDEFNSEFFQMMEHQVDGEIDESGWFSGRIVAFGEDLGELKYPSNVPLEGGETKVGPFKIKLGAVEQKGLSSLDETTNDFLSGRIEKDHGILIFRDGLRVLPYGRTDYDFFGIEERRSMSAGRHFWANRRMIGQISLTQDENGNLRDKAGREGFIKNQAARELKAIVISHLVNFADRHFGAKSEERKIRLAIYDKEKEAAKKAHKNARRQSQKSFKDSLNNQRPKLELKLEQAKRVFTELENDLAISLSKLEELIEITSGLESVRGELKTPTKPARMSESLESTYREYRDLFNEFSELMRVSQEKLISLESKISNKSPFELTQRSFDSRQSQLNRQVSKYESLISSKLERLNLQWKKDAGADRGRFYSEAIEVLEGSKFSNDAEPQLNVIDSIYNNLADTFTIKYESVLRALDKLEAGINLDAAFSMAEEERAYFEDKADKLQKLAQLGISVEVMAHELEQQDQLVTRGLNSLPTDVKEHPGFKTAFNAHKQLTSQIRFLSPLKLSGYQARQDITGAMIESHVLKFFRERFERQRVKIDFSEAFKNITVKDLPSRIYPVFVNIINNAMYWVCLSEERHIKIDILDGLVVIGNSGPPVDEDDVSQLFELFYSRRTNGHGVGLYLCKENLSVANHKIWYGTQQNEKLFSDGANFVIEFNGMEYLG